MLLVTWPVRGYPANCGGSVPCQCGDTVTAGYALPADLGPCPGHGLLVRSHVTLDCQGRQITGTGTGTERYGIYVRGDTGAEVRSAVVRGCQVSGFHHGIRLRAAEDNQIVDNRVHGNGDFAGHVGYGIDVTVGSKNNLIQGNVIDGNADEGIHLASGTGGNQLVANTLFDNYREQIYLLESHGNRLVGNATLGTGSNSLYLKDSRDNVLEGNAFADRVARVTGSASGNLFLDNAFERAQLQFQVYDASPDRVPTGNTVLGGSMSHPAGTCLRFASARDNVVAEVALAGCATEVVSEGTAAEPSANALVSMALSPGKVSVDAHSTLVTGWWLAVRAQDAAGGPVAGARVVIEDALGETVADLLTGADGAIDPQALAEEVRVGTLVTARTPHVVRTSHPAYRADERTVDMRQDMAVTIALSADGPPGGGDGGGGGGNGGGGGDGGPGSVTDPFDRPDSPVVGNGWAEVEGELVVSGGELRTGGARGPHRAVIPALAGSTQHVAADFVSADNGGGPRFGLLLRYQDPLNYYVLYRKVGGGSVLRIARVVEGVETVLAQTGLPNPKVNTAFRLAAHADGTALTLELNGVTRLAVSDATFAGGTVGVVLVAGSAKPQRADNFSADVQ